MTHAHAAVGKNSRSAVVKVKNNYQIRGFLFSAAEAAIKKPGRLDLGLVFSLKPAQAAGVFTRNRVKAAPVLVSQGRLRKGSAQAILINSGNANACTGEVGLQNARHSAGILANYLNIKSSDILLASTGVIGQHLPVTRIEEAIPVLVRGLSPDRALDVSQAILTTDKVVKIASRRGLIAGVPVHVLAMAKGAGMIMPQMATMLCFVMTDVNISADALKSSLERAVSLSFNRITVDGDMSTNDSVIALASGEAGNRFINLENNKDNHIFELLLTDLLTELAKLIVRDGEGATKLVDVRVIGARTQNEARKVAYAVANSPLVKTALNGGDANWGRIMAAVGRSGPPINPGRVGIALDSVPMVKNGTGCGTEAENAATEIMRRDNYILWIDLGRGSFEHNVWTCDFSSEYIDINASYRS